MGADIERETFDEGDYDRFAQRLHEGLQALEELLARPGFGEGPATVGAELEMFLVDGAARPLPLNRQVLRASLDPRATVELGRFNLELNSRPAPLAGAPFTRLGTDLRAAMTALDSAAATHGGRIVAIGILPTLEGDDLHRGALTDLPRYRALSTGLRRLKRAPFEIAIDGEEPLTFSSDDVAVEGASTSFQVHLRVPPGEFARLYNAAQIAIAPVLALSGNSPLFLGRRLWRETRVALCKQATDARVADGAPWRPPPRVSFGTGWVRDGAAELFREAVALYPPLLPASNHEDPLAVARAGGLPHLHELRLHSGTVWSWNRAVYDPEGGGHLRVEMRALPAGPTVDDMLANAAFLLGLTLDLAPDMPRLLPAFPFPYAERNFYRAAQHGLDAELLWPAAVAPSPRPLPARALCADLLPRARRGLAGAGVADDEIDRALGIVEERLASGRTGSDWQLRALALLDAEMPRARALPALLEQYMAHAAGGAPVAAWPDGPAAESSSQK